MPTTKQATDARLTHALAASQVLAFVVIALAVNVIVFGAAILALDGNRPLVIVSVLCAVITAGLAVASLIHGRRLNKQHQE